MMLLSYFARAKVNPPSIDNLKLPSIHPDTASWSFQSIIETTPYFVPYNAVQACLLHSRVDLEQFLHLMNVSLVGLAVYQHQPVGESTLSRCFVNMESIQPDINTKCIGLGVVRALDSWPKDEDTLDERGYYIVTPEVDDLNRVNRLLRYQGEIPPCLTWTERSTKLALSSPYSMEHVLEEIGQDRTIRRNLLRVNVGKPANADD
jgi:hypothetical protein